MYYKKHGVLGQGTSLVVRSNWEKVGREWTQHVTISRPHLTWSCRVSCCQAWPCRDDWRCKHNLITTAASPHGLHGNEVMPNNQPSFLGDKWINVCFIFMAWPVQWRKSHCLSTGKRIVSRGELWHTISFHSNTIRRVCGLPAGLHQEVAPPGMLALSFRQRPTYDTSVTDICGKFNPGVPGTSLFLKFWSIFWIPAETLQCLDT